MEILGKINGIRYHKKPLVEKLKNIISENMCSYVDIICFIKKTIL